MANVQTEKKTTRDNFVYPSDMREAFERQKSEDALALKKIPGIRRRMLNLEHRSKTKTMGIWVVDDPSVRKEVGDLISGFCPEDIAVERNKRFANKDTDKIKANAERRAELAAKLHHGTGGKIGLSIDGFDPSKASVGKKYYFSK